MTMDFSGTAGASTGSDLLPKGLLVFANLDVRGVKTSGSGGGYLDCELTIDQGQPFAGRKLWEMIGDPNNPGNSEKYRQMGAIAITRILETGRGAGPNNPDGYKINGYPDLSGLRVAIKVGIEKGEGGHDDKNRVAEWLTPNPASQSGHKHFLKLQAGDHGLASAPASQPPAQGGFGAPAGNGFGAPQAAPAASGFGFGNTTAPAATTGFGNAQGGAQPGFPQAPDNQPGQSAGTADSQTPTAASASPSDPGATPGWLSQAGGAQQT